LLLIKSIFFTWGPQGQFFGYGGHGLPVEPSVVKNH